MAKEDLCLEILTPTAFSAEKFNQEMIHALLEVLSLVPDTPFERIQDAVKEEIQEMNRQTEFEILKFCENYKISEELLSIVEQLHHQPYRFPREELQGLFPKFLDSPQFSSLVNPVSQVIERHKDLERRLSWLMRPLTLSEIQNLDPKSDCDIIYHSMSYEFRWEMKLFSILYEIRSVIVASTNSFLLTTHELSQAALKRLIDTVLLVSNILEWGLGSYRGRTCIEKINAIHGQYHIPEEGYRFILAGIMFLPEEWNSRLGWRSFTLVEKLGWFYSILKIGKAMNIGGLTEDYEEMKSWYWSYCFKHSEPGEVKRRLFDQIVSQVLVVYPERVRPLVRTALLAGMDDVFRRATGYPDLPKSTIDSVKSAFFYIGHLSAVLPRIPWFRTLQNNIVYPKGYNVHELGVSGRSAYIPQMSSQEAIPEFTLEEVAQHGFEESLWVIIDSEVYDLTQFSKNHPGGLKVLLKYAGKDASQGFQEIHHSDEAKIYMKNFKIGRLRAVPLKCPFSCVFGIK